MKVAVFQISNERKSQLSRLQQGFCSVCMFIHALVQEKKCQYHFMESMNLIFLDFFVFTLIDKTYCLLFFSKESQHHKFTMISYKPC